MLISTHSLLAQSDLKSENTKTVNTATNSIPTDTSAKNLQTSPLVIKDSTQTVTVDTLDNEDSEPLEHPIEYNAKDSIRYETKGQKIFLFGDGRVKYDGMDMKAEFIEIDNEKKYFLFMKIISNLPMGYEMWETITTNYLQLKTIYKQRKNHKLKEDWGAFCAMIENLPMADIIFSDGS